MTANTIASFFMTLQKRGLELQVALRAIAGQSRFRFVSGSGRRATIVEPAATKCPSRPADEELMHVVIFLAILAANPHLSDARLDEIIAGDWCAGSRKAFHEEFSLRVENGVRTFDSWLHQRPDYRITRASRKRLVLRNSLDNQTETYVRRGRCVTFGNPYKD